MLGVGKFLLLYFLGCFLRWLSPLHLSLGIVRCGKIATFTAMRSGWGVVNVDCWLWVEDFILTRAFSSTGGFFFASLPPGLTRVATCWDENGRWKSNFASLCALRCSTNWTPVSMAVVCVWNHFRKRDHCIARSEHSYRCKEKNKFLLKATINHLIFSYLLLSVWYVPWIDQNWIFDIRNLLQANKKINTLSVW